jgi:hypothetical protein
MLIKVKVIHFGEKERRNERENNLWRRFIKDWYKRWNINFKGRWEWIDWNSKLLRNRDKDSVRTQNQ